MFSSADTDTEPRLQRLQELQEFTETCRKQLENVFKELGWRRYEPACVLDLEEELVACPFDPGHRVPQRSLDQHKESCLLKRMDYSSEEQKEMPNTSFCYENSSVRTFVMDEETQHQVIAQARSAAPLMKMEGVFWQGQYSGEPRDVPQNHKRALCDLTVADRVVLYDHVISKLSNQEEPAPSSSNEDLYVDLVKKLQKDEQQKEPKTHLELMAEKRDYKRRRQSYRAKNVHITKKSYTEVIREVINVHTEELSQEWREEEPERRRHSERSHERSHERRHKRHREQNPERSLERHREQNPKRSHERHREQSLERSHERHREQSCEQNHEQSHEHHHDSEPKKKKKKRQRDSRSPVEHHERKKKKKKRKREEEEK